MISLVWKAVAAADDDVAVVVVHDAVGGGADDPIQPRLPQFRPFPFPHRPPAPAAASVGSSPVSSRGL